MLTGIECMNEFVDELNELKFSTMVAIQPKREVYCWIVTFLNF